MRAARVRVRRMRRGVRASAAVVLAALAIACASRPPDAAPADPAARLTPARGDWTSRSYVADAALLEQIATTEPARLPQLGDARTGAYFERLVSDPTRDLLVRSMISPDVETSVEILTAGSRVFLAYVRGMAAGVPLDDEAAELMGFQMRLAAKQLEMARVIEQQRAGMIANAEAARASRSMMAAGQEAMLTGTALGLADRVTFRTPARIRLAQHLARSGPALLEGLDASERSAVLALVERARDAELEPAARAEIEASLAALRAAPP